MYTVYGLCIALIWVVLQLSPDKHFTVALKFLSTTQTLARTTCVDFSPPLESSQLFFTRRDACSIVHNVWFESH